MNVAIKLWRLFITYPNKGFVVMKAIEQIDYVNESATSVKYACEQ